MVTSSTSVFGYLLPVGEDSRLVNLYSRFIEADPSATIVPLAARRECLESAVHNVRTGLIQGVCVDRSLYSEIACLVDARTNESTVSGVIDTVFADPKTGVLVGDCVAVKAVSEMTGFIEAVMDPVILMYRDCWETRVAMTALSGWATMMEIAAEPSEHLDNIPTGCVVEYCSDNQIDTSPFDLVVNPPDGFKPADWQATLAISGALSKQVVQFEALRLAYSIGKFRGLAEQICLETANSYEKILAAV